jgi:hypothetical protein
MSDVSRSKPPIEMWEYMFTDIIKSVYYANETYGKQGWEMCGIDRGVFWFKRRFYQVYDPSLNPTA